MNCFTNPFGLVGHIAPLTNSGVIPSFFFFKPSPLGLFCGLCLALTLPGGGRRRPVPRGLQGVIIVFDVQQELVQKACEMVLPAVTRALADAFSSKIDNMVQQWQRQAIQQVDATLQDSILNLVRFCLVPPRAPLAVPRRSAARRWGARWCT